MKKLILAMLAGAVAASPAIAAPQPAWTGHDQSPRSGHSRGDRADRGDHDARFGNRGVGVQQRHWRRGERFDSHYAGNFRVIADPGFHRLHDAPRGYRWIQSGNDAVLVGLTTGIVAAVAPDVIR